MLKKDLHRNSTEKTSNPDGQVLEQGHPHLSNYLTLKEIRRNTSVITAFTQA